MSREVIDGADGDGDGDGWAAGGSQRPDPADLSEPAGPPARAVTPASAGPRTASARGAAAVLLAALVLGFVAGGWQARQAGRQVAQAATRLLVWAGPGLPVGPTPDAAGGQPPSTSFQATARTIGGAVLLREIDTPFGAVRFDPEERVDAERSTAIPIRLTPDCSTFAAWRSDWSKAPRTGYALVRDQAGAPVRRVTVDLIGDLLLADIVDSCSPQPSATASVPLGTDAAPPAIQYTAMTGQSDGTLSFEVQAVGLQRVTLDVAVLDLIAGRTAGHFTLTTSPAMPLTLEAGRRVAVVLHLTYHCTAGEQVLPSADSILQASATDPAAGTPANEAGWDASAAADAVRGAASTAGCPLAGG